MNKLALYIHNNESLDDNILYEFEKLNCPQRVIMFNQALNTSCDLPSMHARNLYYWDGPVVATCVNSALYLLRCPCVRRKLIYIKDYTVWSKPTLANYVLDVMHNLEIISSDINVKSVWGCDTISSLKDLVCQK